MCSKHFTHQATFQAMAVFVNVTYHWSLIMVLSFIEYCHKGRCRHLFLVPRDATVHFWILVLHMCASLCPPQWDNLLSRNQECHPTACKQFFHVPPPHLCTTVAKLSLFHRFTGCQRLKQSKPINLEMLPLTNQELSLLLQLPEEGAFLVA